MYTWLIKKTLLLDRLRKLSDSSPPPFFGFIIFTYMLAKAPKQMSSKVNLCIRAEPVVPPNILIMLAALTWLHSPADFKGRAANKF